MAFCCSERLSTCVDSSTRGWPVELFLNLTHGAMMTGRTTTFRRPDTGETKDFTPERYRIDTTNQYSTQREGVEVHFYRANDGYRIDRTPDGSFQDKWGVVWEPV